MEIGIRGQAETMAAKENSAKEMGSGSLAVFATPAMVALMEKAACESVQPHLKDGETTVGTLMQIEHINATPMGMTVKAESLLEEIDGRKLIFSVQAFDESGLIGKGRHERFIISAERFMEKTNGKLNKA